MQWDDSVDFTLAREVQVFEPANNARGEHWASLTQMTFWPALKTGPSSPRRKHHDCRLSISLGSGGQTSVSIAALEDNGSVARQLSKEPLS